MNIPIVAKSELEEADVIIHPDRSANIGYETHNALTVDKNNVISVVHKHTALSNEELFNIGMSLIKLACYKEHFIPKA